MSFASEQERYDNAEPPKANPEAEERVHLEILADPWELDDVLDKGLRDERMRLRAISILAELHAVFLNRPSALNGVDAVVAKNVEAAFDIVFEIVEEETKQRVYG